MKHFEYSTSVPTGSTLGQISGWYRRLQQLHGRLRPHFARPEVHQQALRYLQAVLSDVPRKNGWQIAEQARQARPHGIQRLLSQAVWDQDAVRDDVRRLVAETLLPPGEPPEADDTPFPVLVLDESGFPKRGRHSAGVAPQYCGCTGRVENCQVGVFLSLVTAAGHALIDRELYLPEDWCADLPRRQTAHIPDSVAFRTKPELGQQMIARAQAAGLPLRWVVADTVYGHSSELRAFLEEQDLSYALAVPCTEVVCVQTRTGLLLSDVATIAQQAVRARDWQRLSASQGSKGERLFDWARLPIALAGVADRRHWLVVRRCLDEPHELAYYLVWAPADTPLSLMVQAIGARWRIEEDLHTCKALGLDHYEVRSYLGWSRHLTLVLLAAAFLLDITVGHQRTPATHADPTTGPALIALSCAEARHLLAHLFFPPPSAVPLICQWSLFRRTHQSWACYYHRRRRAKAG
jgi:SRSO17 transposase